VQTLFDLRAPRPHWYFGQTVNYSILRDNRALVLPVTLTAYPLTQILVQEWGTILFALVSLLVAAFVFIRCPHDPAARVLFLWASGLLGATTWSFGLQVGDLVNGIGFWLFKATTFGAYMLFWIAGLHFALIFPQPRSLVVKHPSIIPAIYVAPYLLYAFYLAAIYPGSSSMLEWIGRWTPGESVLALIYLALMVVVMILCYRASRGIERQKIRWVVFAALLSGGGGLVLWTLPGAVLGYSLIPPNALGLLVLPFPLAIAIAILRHRLFDIDILIRRTLIYGVLTALLALVYFASVVVLQGFFRALTAQGSDVAIILSTLGIAALFNPLHSRVQDAIDSRFYRRKYDAQKVLAAFGATVRDEVQLENLTAHLLRVVDETMKPASVSLWLKEPHPNEKQ
jgi:hypothetical protein